MIMEPQRAAMMGQAVLPSAEEIGRRARACVSLFLKGAERKEPVDAVRWSRDRNQKIVRLRRDWCRRAILCRCRCIPWQDGSICKKPGSQRAQPGKHAAHPRQRSLFFISLVGCRADALIAAAHADFEGRSREVAHVSHHLIEPDREDTTLV